MAGVRHDGQLGGGDLAAMISAYLRGLSRSSSPTITRVGAAMAHRLAVRSRREKGQQQLQKASMSSVLYRSRAVSRAGWLAAIQASEKFSGQVT